MQGSATILLTAPRAPIASISPSMRAAFIRTIPLGSCLIPLGYNRLVSNFIQTLPVSELILSSQVTILR